jgi:hypothetical protein
MFPINRVTQFRRKLAGQGIGRSSSQVDPEEIKFFVSNAPPETSVQTMSFVAFLRWRVERCFEVHKTQIGLDHYEGRLYLGLKRHLLINSLRYLVLSRMRQRLGEEKSGTHGMPGKCGHRGPDPFWWIGQQPSKRLLEKTAAKIRSTQKRNALARRCHTKRTRKQLVRLGIRLSHIPQSEWDSA